jgi:hypothetical protein
MRAVIYEVNQGVLIMKKVLLSTVIPIIISLLIFSGCTGVQGLQGEQGEAGISINWLGSVESAPSSPSLNDAYYDTTDNKSYIWDGDSWEILAQDGTNTATSPVIFNMETSVTTTTATISWDTTKYSTSQIEYGETDSYGSTTVLDADMVADHSVIVDGLSLNTTYHYRVKSTDSVDNEEVSGDYSFTTLSKILFESGSGRMGIYTIDADGSNLTNISTNTQGWDVAPRWSSIANKIVFQSERDGNWEIYVMDTNGLNQSRLTYNTSVDSSPSWSADGTKIIFESYRDGDADIYIMDSDGLNQTRLTNTTTLEREPLFSPDGSKIVYSSWDNGQSEIYIMDSDGSNQTRLTDNTVTDSSPSWSADGSKIAYEHDGNICMMDADGSNVTQITHYPLRCHDPSISPSGDQIAFVYEFNGYHIYLIDIDGSNMTDITNNSYLNRTPSWSW